MINRVTRPSCRPQVTSVHHTSDQPAGLQTSVGVPFHVVDLRGGMPYEPAPQIVVERRLVGKRLKPEAWCFAVVMCFLFWPCAFIPCCLEECKEPIYEDVYVSPLMVPQQVVVMRP